MAKIVTRGRKAVGPGPQVEASCSNRKRISQRLNNQLVIYLASFNLFLQNLIASDIWKNPTGWGFLSHLKTNKERSSTPKASFSLIFLRKVSKISLCIWFYFCFMSDSKLSTLMKSCSSILMLCVYLSVLSKIVLIRFKFKTMSLYSTM